MSFFDEICPNLVILWFLGVPCKEFFRTCNVLPFSSTHLALWRGKVKDPSYMQNKKDPRISLVPWGSLFGELFDNFFDEFFDEIF